MCSIQKIFDFIEFIHKPFSGSSTTKKDSLSQLNRFPSTLIAAVAA